MIMLFLGSQEGNSAIRQCDSPWAIFRRFHSEDEPYGSPLSKFSLSLPPSRENFFRDRG